MASFNADLSRWSAIVAAIWMLSCGGLGYSFAIYSSQLKEALDYTQENIALLGTAKDIGDNFGLIAGILSAFISPSAMLIIGALQNFLGYSAVYLIATKAVPEPPFWQVLFCIWMGVNGATYFNTAALVTGVSHFPNSRGVVLGMLTAMVGLSGAMFAELWSAIFAPNQLAYLLLISLGPSIVAVLVMPFLQVNHEHGLHHSHSHSHALPMLAGSEDSSKLNTLLLMNILLAAYLMSQIVVSTFVDISQGITRFVATGMIILIVLPAYLPLRVLLHSYVGDGPKLVEWDSDDSIKRPLLPSRPKSEDEFLPPISKDPIEATGSGNSIPELIRANEDCGIAEGLSMAEFWLMFLSVLCSAGSGCTVMNNLAQMGQAQGIDDMKIPVVLFSIWNYAGRLGGGFYSEHLVRKFDLPRPWMLVITHILMVGGHLLFAYAVPGSIYVGSLIIGVGFGSTMAMIPAIGSEIFGLTNFGMFFNLFTSALPVGSYLFSGLLAGYVYDIEAAKDTLNVPGEEPKVCHGAHCFWLTFIVMAAVCVVAIVADLCLVVKTSLLYKRMYPRYTD